MIETPYRDVRFFSSSDSSEMSQQTPKRPSSNDALTLYVKRVPKSMTDEGLRHLFIAHGKVVKVQLEVNENFPTNRAFVEMSSKEECNAAIKELNRFEDGLGGRIFVDFKKPSFARSSFPPNRNVPPHGPGAGRGDTLLLAASNSPSSRKLSPRMHSQQSRHFTQEHTGNFSIRGRGMSRGRGQLRPRPDFYRPFHSGSTHGQRYSAPNYGPRYGGHQYGPRYPHQFPHRGGGRTPRFPPPRHQVPQISPQASDTKPQDTDESMPCLNCQTRTPLRCSGCKNAPYCSKECQTIHWGVSHKLQCHLMRDQTDASSIDLSQFSVSINPRIIEAMKEMPAVVEYFENLKAKEDSDTDSVCSSKSEDPGLPFNELLQMKLTDFITPSQFYVQHADDQSSGALPRVWECCVHGIAPSGGDTKWKEGTIDVCSAAGLALGGLCKVLCYSRKNQVYQTKVVLRNGVELSERLISAGVAQLVGNTKYKVTGSLHRKLEPGQSIQLVIDASSIKGVSEFYTQVAHKSCMPELTAFTQMQPKLNNYATHIANQPPPGYRPETFRAKAGDYVLAPFESEWYRGLVTVSNDERAVVAFIDYGNIDAIIQSQLIPLPRQFMDPPALAVLCKLHGLSETSDEKCQLKCVDVIKSIAASSEKVSATVRSVKEDCLTVDLFDSNNKNVAAFLLGSGYATAMSSEQIPSANQMPDAVSISCDGPGDTPPRVVDDVMPPLLTTSEDIPILASTNDSATTLSATSESISSLSYDNKITISAEEGMPALLPTNEDMPPLLSTNDGMPSLLPSNEGMPPLLPSNENKTPLFTANDDMPALLSTDENVAPVSSELSASIKKQTSVTSSAAHKRADASTQKPQSHEICLPNRSVIYERDIPSLSLEISEQTMVLLLSASDLQSIYITSADHDSLNHFLTSMGSMTQGWQSESHLASIASPLVEGEVLFALEPESEEWDRVVVLNYHPNQPVVRVRSIDFGASYDVDMRNIREMTAQGASLVAQAINVTLAGVSGTLNAGGKNLLSSLVQQRVVVSGSKVKGQLMCLLFSEDGQNINELLKTHVTPSVHSNDLNSHGSSSDGSLPSTSPAFAAGDTMTSCEAQIMECYQVIKSLKNEIALLSQRPVVKGKPKKKVDESVEEFTL